MKIKMSDKHVQELISVFAIILFTAPIFATVIMSPSTNYEVAISIQCYDNEFFTYSLFTPTPYKYPSAHIHLKVVSIDMSRWLGHTISANLIAENVLVDSIYLMVISAKKDVGSQGQYVIFPVKYCIDIPVNQTLVMNLSLIPSGTHIEVKEPYYYLLSFFYYDMAYIGRTDGRGDIDGYYNPWMKIELHDITIIGDA